MPPLFDSPVQMYLSPAHRIPAESLNDLSIEADRQSIVHLYWQEICSRCAWLAATTGTRPMCRRVLCAMQSDQPTMWSWVSVWMAGGAVAIWLQVSHEALAGQSTDCKTTPPMWFQQAPGFRFCCWGGGPINIPHNSYSVTTHDHTLPCIIVKMTQVMNTKNLEHLKEFAWSINYQNLKYQVMGGGTVPDHMIHWDHSHYDHHHANILLLHGLPIVAFQTIVKLCMAITLQLDRLDYLTHWLPPSISTDVCLEAVASSWQRRFLNLLGSWEAGPSI